MKTGKKQVKLRLIEGGAKELQKLNLRKSRRYCTHASVTLGLQSDPDVICDVCGEKLDPLDLLRDMALEERSLLTWLDTWELERDQVREELEDLKRQVKNAKAQKRRLTKPGS